MLQIVISFRSNELVSNQFQKKKHLMKALTVGVNNVNYGFLMGLPQKVTNIYTCAVCHSHHWTTHAIENRFGHWSILCGRLLPCGEIMHLIKPGDDLKCVCQTGL